MTRSRSGAGPARLAVAVLAACGGASSDVPDAVPPGDFDPRGALDCYASNASRSYLAFSVPPAPGAALDQTLGLLFRAYLAPGRAVAPDPRALLTERVLHVTP